MISTIYALVPLWMMCSILRWIDSYWRTIWGYISEGNDIHFEWFLLLRGPHNVVPSEIIENSKLNLKDHLAYFSAGYLEHLQWPYYNRVSALKFDTVFKMIYFNSMLRQLSNLTLNLTYVKFGIKFCICQM